MMNYLWAAIVFLSVIYSFFSGSVDALSHSVLNGATDAVNLIISIAGIMCFWSGIMEVGNASGLTEILAKIFRPVIGKLFPEYKNNFKALSAISMNITANLLGLGNAATPFGIAAMKEMQSSRHTKQKHIANNSMVMFVIINTVPFQLFSTTLIALRAENGSMNPFAILPVVWLTSICSLCTGILITKLFEKCMKGHK